MKLFKGMSSGTTALVYSGAPPSQELIARVLEPVRGIGADLFVAVDDDVRAFTMQEEISPPSAVIRLAAAFLHSQAPASTRWDFTVGGGEARVDLKGGEYVLNHGPWAVAGGPRAIADGHDCVIQFAGVDSPRPALRIRVGDRTVAVSALGNAEELSGVDFRTAPQAEPACELVAAIAILGERNVDLTDADGDVRGTQKIGALQLRGVDQHLGEVYSADALAVASAAAAHTWLGERAATEWIAVFGGGNTRVELGENALALAEAELFAEVTWRK